MLRDKPKFSDLSSQDSIQWIKQNLSLIGVPTSGTITLQNIENTKIDSINTSEKTPNIDSINKTDKIPNAKNTNTNDKIPNTDSIKTNAQNADNHAIESTSNATAKIDSINPNNTTTQKDILESCIEILEKMADMKVIWLHLQECTGCSESFLRTESPSFEVLIFDLFKIVYHDLVMAPSGHGAVLDLESAAKSEKYVLLVEGSVPMDYAANYITLGNRNGFEEVSHLIKNAEIVFAVGTCSSFGGIQTAYPNPTNGHALTELFNREIVNIPGCPPSDKNVMATLMYYFLFECAPRLDSLKRPLWAYNKSVHDLCERKSFFMSGDFVESFDDKNLAKGYCLYKVGCKGPYTYNNCPKVKFNAKTSWPVQGGHGCIGCSEPNFWDNFGNIEKPLSNDSFFILNTAFLGRNDRIPHIREFKTTISGSIWSKDFEDSKVLSTGKASCDFGGDFHNINGIKVIESSILDSKDYLSFVDLHNVENSILLDFSESKSLILRQAGDSITKLSNFSFEINPKLVLKNYESKNKQGKKLYENYKRVLANNYSFLQNLSEDSKISSNLFDIFCLFYVILCDNVVGLESMLKDSKNPNFIEYKLENSKDSNNENSKNTNFIESKSQDSIDSKNTDSNLQDSKTCENSNFIESKMLFNPAILEQFFRHAHHFKFPYISELSSKFKGADSINIDTNKSLSLAMAYTIGGLDSFGVCYSIMCDTFNALCETLQGILDSMQNANIESSTQNTADSKNSNLDSKNITESITLDSKNLQNSNNIESNKDSKSALILQGKIFESKLIQSLITKAFSNTKIQIFILQY
ncbi:hydrogenase small subunit [Helicobacter saguini]|uniref:Hydrogenase small subunit n=2 Tax=Helicobacter saguini TaxID=1548018 RepID=A0A347VTR5_9HELI|nr:hydrogenase small subunit [Helicobacter saguini]MWV67471.1 hydrogenase small subunit [Helicobacter saguini]MWV69822.1 hydrogenase small subunit [Helicobacter saguini]MWV72960.1 hydrogenase small subunit [Helicobacter saguini]TLD95701.1 hypothetical protein LS64_002055 [Helicobacter saguini]